MAGRHRRCKWSLRSIKIVKIYKYNVYHKHSKKRTSLNLDLNEGHLRLFKCTECEKVFGQKGSLLVHKRSHSNAKPYICAKCNRGFVTKAGLVIHVSGHSIRNLAMEKQNHCDSPVYDNQNQNQNKQSKKKIVSQFLRGQRSHKSRRVMVITHDSTGQESSTELFGNKTSVAKKEMADDKFPPQNMKNKRTERMKQYASFTRNMTAVVEQSTHKSVRPKKTRKSGRPKKQIPKHRNKTEPLTIMSDDTTSYSDETYDQDNDDDDYVLEVNNQPKAVLLTKVSDNRMITRSLGKVKQPSNNRKCGRKRKVNKFTAKTSINSNVEKDVVEDISSSEEDSKSKPVQKKVQVKKVKSERDTNPQDRADFVKKTRVYQCDICSKMCCDSSQLKSHHRLHTGEKPFKCKLCNKSFRMKACLNVHIRVHTGEKPYHCSTCSKDFRYQNTFNKHVATHQSNAEKNIKCKICDKRFITRESLWDHKQKLRKCDSCSLLFCSFSALNLHKHQTHVDTFSVGKTDGKYCQFCRKTFKSNYTFFIHMQKHARKGMPIKFPCPICSETFDSYDQLRIHRKSHTVKRDKCVTCPWSHCGRKLTSQTRLDSHLKRHNGETQYLCCRCGMNFTDCVFYLKHRRACYQRIVKYDCVICGKFLSGHSALQKHILSHKGEKPCQCEICGARFNNSSHLKRHKRIHVRKGEMPPFDNNSTNVSQSAGTILCFPDASTQQQQFQEYGVELGNEQVVAYFLDKETEQVELKTELLSATANVAKQME